MAIFFGFRLNICTEDRKLRLFSGDKELNFLAFFDTGEYCALYKVSGILLPFDCFVLLYCTKNCSVFDVFGKIYFFSVLFLFSHYNFKFFILIVLYSPCLYCSISEDVPLLCNDHNMFCCSDTSSADFECPDCCLRYHIACAERTENCGCKEIPILEPKYVNFNIILCDMFYIPYGCHVQLLPFFFVCRARSIVMDPKTLESIFKRFFPEIKVFLDLTVISL